MIRSIVLSLALLAPLPALAHNVISSVFPSGTDIEGEVGFSNGDMAVDLLIEVFDEAGTKLGETRTDADGFFLFTPKEPVTHIFRGDLGAGHVAEVQMAANEVAELLGQSIATPAASASGQAATVSADTALSDQSRAELATMIRNELRPLRQELTAFKNKSNFQSVLGGIGYIFGLFGLGFYIAARRKMDNNT
ncbi:cobalt ABC transporter permease [Pseudophaeobacter sp. EL27]|uniref:cobalt ABC transporter permease n=1 Tax=Pseudophaeobacter sp. EL27 TaxID=2107580 RepID=UPI000EFA97F8|nr:cobalt ABC transporter permease [Pseudophaeobacter sp. EL27]